MNLQEEISRVHKIMSERFQNYVETIKEVYGMYMGKNNLERLNEITDYGQYVIIGRNGNINAHANYNGVYLPVEAYMTIKELRGFNQYGTDKSHKLYDEETMIINDNTFYDYIHHVILTGSTPEDYYEDLLLHETMHFCGSGGASALKEGINEYLTRKTALRHGFRTSACGYPKEVKLVYELEKLFGESIINQIAFINDEEEMLQFIENVIGKKSRRLFETIMAETEKEFYQKYYSHMNDYDGIQGVYNKAVDYSKIDYCKVYEQIALYKKNNMRR